MTPAVASSPVSGAERIMLLDVLRGFALLGILLMNIEAFSTPFGRAQTGIDPTLHGLDLWVDAASFVLVQGKFYPLFSLLFGAGFAMMMARAAARGRAGEPPYLRRTLALLVIGLLHYLFVWSGDILTVYALGGLILLAGFRHTPVARLWKWGMALFAMPLLLTLLVGIGGELAQGDPEANMALQGQLAAQQRTVAELDGAHWAAYGPDGSYPAANAQRRADFAVELSYLPYALLPTVVGLFLFGAWLLRSGILLDPAGQQAFFRRWRLLGIGIGLPLVLAGVGLVPGSDHARLDLASALAAVFGQLGGLLLCLGYLATIALELQHPRRASGWHWLAPAGRMALTHYLLQSLVCTLVFYGYGLGYYGQLPRAWQLPFAVLLFVAQVALSHWWLARFRFGPVEWLWRSVTYLQWQPMRWVA